MTKVMTLLLAFERLSETETVTITPEMADAIKAIPKTYVKLGLQEGEEISVKDICARAGVSRMSFYRYYSTKGVRTSYPFGFGMSYTTFEF